MRGNKLRWSTMCMRMGRDCVEISWKFCWTLNPNPSRNLRTLPTLISLFRRLKKAKSARHWHVAHCASVKRQEFILSVKNLSVYHLESTSKLVRLSSPVALFSPFFHWNNKWHTSIQWKKAIIHVAVCLENNEKHDNWYTLSSSHPALLHVLLLLLTLISGCSLPRWKGDENQVTWEEEAKVNFLIMGKHIGLVAHLPRQTSRCCSFYLSVKWNLILSFVEINLLRRPFQKKRGRQEGATRRNEKFFIKLLARRPLAGVKLWANIFWHHQADVINFAFVFHTDKRVFPL